jgi:hypothetical protein
MKSGQADRISQGVVILTGKENPMTKLILLLVAFAISLPSGMVAADIDGKWKAEFTTPDGTPRTNTFTFKAEGTKLTGSVAGTQDETPIQNGTISGDEISFTAERPFGKFTYKGKISGDQIKMKVEFNENSFEITAKRVRG